MRVRMKPAKDEIFFKKSSIAVQIHHDTEHDAAVYFYNRRTNSIVGYFKLPLMVHCRESMQNVEPIKKPKKKKKYIPVGRRP